jgi:hypothetical protein
VVENVYDLLAPRIHDMNEANRKAFQDEGFTRSLEELVKARTEQLMQAVSQNEQFLTLLTQIQSMESLEQIREAIRAGIEAIRAPMKKVVPQGAQAPKFGGEAGESVPEVDPEDIKAIWQIGEKLRAEDPAVKAVGVEVMKRACKPGANVEATWYRSSAIWMLTHVAQQQLAPWLKEGKVSDPVFRTMASIPMEWMGSEERQTPPFNIDEVLRRLNEH